MEYYAHSLLRGARNLALACLYAGTKKMRRVLVRQNEVKHYASYQEGVIGLAELVRHQAVTMEKLYERRVVSPEGSVKIHARLCYRGVTRIRGGAQKLIKPGDIISAEFCIGENPGEFLFRNGQAPLPRKFVLYWDSPQKPGRIIPR